MASTRQLLPHGRSRRFLRRRPSHRHPRASARRTPWLSLRQHWYDKDALDSRSGKGDRASSIPEEFAMTLNEQRIVVLGGTSGIGYAVAKAASEEGAEVV